MEAYLDHAATTPVRPEALAVLSEVLGGESGNPSGVHARARASRRRLDDARDDVAAALGADPGGVVFTAGGTEADNLAVFGVHDALGGTIVATAIEHHAVLRPVEARGGRLAPVDRSGRLGLDALVDLLDHDVRLVSIMAVNNESGVVQPLREAAALVREHAPDAVLHTDAVQAVPWLDLSDLLSVVDLASISAHKFGGPAGVGALVVRPGTPLRAQMLGGGQERERRSGTQNVAGAAAMAAALTQVVAAREDDVARIGRLRDRLVEGLLEAVPNVHEIGVTDTGRRHKVAGSAHLCVAGIESEALLFLLEEAGVSASAAASCASGAMEPSHVLAAMGVPPEQAQGALRLSLGWTTTAAEVDHALAVLPAAVDRLRSRAAVST